MRFTEINDDLWHRIRLELEISFLRPEKTSPAAFKLPANRRDFFIYEIAFIAASCRLIKPPTEARDRELCILIRYKSSELCFGFFGFSFILFQLDLKNFPIADREEISEIQIGKPPHPKHLLAQKETFSN